MNQTVGIIAIHRVAVAPFDILLQVMALLSKVREERTDDRNGPTVGNVEWECRCVVALGDLSQAG